MADDPLLCGIDDKIPFLRVFAHRLRDGRSSRSHRPISASHVADEIFHVAKTFQELGAPDPRLNNQGAFDIRYRNLLTAYRKEDLAPTRVKPLPIQVLHRAQRHVLLCAPQPADIAAMDLLWLGFYFLLRPGEYVQGRENTPLMLKDVSLMIRSQKVNFCTCPYGAFHLVTHATLTFDTQKNRVRGETIGHSLSGDPYACPVKALVRRVYHLRCNNAPPDTPLCAYYHCGFKHTVKHQQLATLISIAAAAVPELNYLPTEFGPRSLRSGGAMALLCGNIDTDVIKLVGRWKSDAIFRYLHAQALPVITDLARTMLKHGRFTLLPGSNVPPSAVPILQHYDHLAAQVQPLPTAYGVF